MTRTIVTIVVRSVACLDRLQVVVADARRPGDVRLQPVRLAGRQLLTEEVDRDVRLRLEGHRVEVHLRDLERPVRAAVHRGELGVAGSGDHTQDRAPEALGRVGPRCKLRQLRDERLVIRGKAAFPGEDDGRPPGRGVRGEAAVHHRAGRHRFGVLRQEARLVGLADLRQLRGKERGRQRRVPTQSTTTTNRKRSTSRLSCPNMVPLTSCTGGRLLTRAAVLPRPQCCPCVGIANVGSAKKTLETTESRATIGRARGPVKREALQNGAAPWARSAPGAVSPGAVSLGAAGVGPTSRPQRRPSPPARRSTSSRRGRRARSRFRSAGSAPRARSLRVPAAPRPMPSEG